MFNIQINDVEQASFDAWYSEHKKVCSKGPQSHDMTMLSVDATGVGNKVVAICPACTEQKDITDYASW